MSRIEQPTCHIVAGPNGSGKTTFAMKYLPSIVSCKNFINADEIAKGISPLDFTAGQLQASKLFLCELEQKINNRETFAFETTLAGRVYLSRIREWRKQGWQVSLWFLYLPSAEFSAQRVALRVQQGGHNVPEETIIRRFPRTVKNLFDYAEICDSTFCFDNSQERIRPIFEKRLDTDYFIYEQQVFSHLKELARNE
ncbi:MAG: hypothetical protein IJS08_03360 [Victivallales bacterium]|nr:hypothetical protein [Victivallales bacterium]